MYTIMFCSYFDRKRSAHRSGDIPTQTQVLAKEQKSVFPESLMLEKRSDSFTLVPGSFTLGGIELAVFPVSDLLAVFRATGT
jgi:hypothetical protein